MLIAILTMYIIYIMITCTRSREATPGIACLAYSYNNHVIVHQESSEDFRNEQPCQAFRKNIDAAALQMGMKN